MVAARASSPIRRIRTGQPEVDRHFDSLEADLRAMQDRLDAAIEAAVAGIPGAPTGTGIPHVVSDAYAPAASRIVNVDVDAAANIALSKLAGGADGDVARTIGSTPSWAKPTGEYLLCAVDLAIDSSVASGANRDVAIYTAAASPSGKNRINITRWEVYVETLAVNGGGALNANISLGKASGGSTLSGAGVVVYTLASALGDVQATVSSTVDMPSANGFEGFLDAGQSIWARLVVNYGTPITTPGAVRVCVWGRRRP